MCIFSIANHHLARSAISHSGILAMGSMSDYIRENSSFKPSNFSSWSQALTLQARFLALSKKREKAGEGSKQTQQLKKMCNKPPPSCCNRPSIHLPHCTHPDDPHRDIRPSRHHAVFRNRGGGRGDSFFFSQATVFTNSKI